MKTESIHARINVPRLDQILQKVRDYSPETETDESCSGAWLGEALTVLWDLPRAPFQEETDTPASGFDELDGSGVGHVPRGFPVDLDDLVPDLEANRKP